MNVAGQVDGRSHPAPPPSREVEWAAVVADPDFWVWLQGHATAEAEGRLGMEREAFEDLAAAAAKILYVRAQTVRQLIKSLSTPPRPRTPRQGRGSS